MTLNRHLSVMNIQTDPLCPACGEEEETSYHLLGQCYAYMVSRYSTMAAHTMESEEYAKLRPTTLLQFTRATKGFSWPLVVLGCCIGPNIHGLSHGRLWLSAPKVKVKVRPTRLLLLARHKTGNYSQNLHALSAPTMSAGCQEEHPDCKKSAPHTRRSNWLSQIKLSWKWQLKQLCRNRKKI